ncbi:unnamed protein product [Brachionus calyciflorus]|uniref:Uncharacterized protein n=1 Tax=Brachionus calyciflorus TaxID=104777 RepID=A0A813NWZ1_9BILA|nr:unnamed protein product [Brachionus calyciflorus]
MEINGKYHFKSTFSEQDVLKNKSANDFVDNNKNNLVNDESKVKKNYLQKSQLENLQNIEKLDLNSSFKHEKKSFRKQLSLQPKTNDQHEIKNSKSNWSKLKARMIYIGHAHN